MQFWHTPMNTTQNLSVAVAKANRCKIYTLEGPNELVIFGESHVKVSAKTDEMLLRVFPVVGVEGVVPAPGRPSWLFLGVRFHTWLLSRFLHGSAGQKAAERESGETVLLELESGRPSNLHESLFLFSHLLLFPLFLVGLLFGFKFVLPVQLISLAYSLTFARFGVIDARNRWMVKELLHHRKHKVILVVCGLMHCSGMIKLLEKEGYRAT